jgi:hypothetical protein
LADLLHRFTLGLRTPEAATFRAGPEVSAVCIDGLPAPDYDPLQTMTLSLERTDVMRIAIPATYTPRVIMELLVFVPMLLLILFGITAVGIGGFYFAQVLVSSLRGKPYQAFQKRTVAAIQAGNLGWMAIACGPILGLFLYLLTLPVMIMLPDFTLLAFAKGLLLITSIGTVAGIIGGGAFWACSALLRPVRKAVNRLRGRGVWDPELDGMP